MSAFWTWWQGIPGRLDPTLLQIGGFRVQYYGLMYLVAFAMVYLLAGYRVRRETRFALRPQQLQDLTTLMMAGVVAGGRLGYVLFYNPGHYLRHPLEIVLPFSFDGGVHFTGLAGMSYHGGVLGVVLAAWFYVRRQGLSFLTMGDLYAPVIPLGYLFGRLGNFINGELYGRVTTLPVGMRFPLAPGDALRHPSQLYEAGGEGLLLFAVLWPLRRRPMPDGTLLAIYLAGYGLVRFVIEFVREPDAHLGTVLGPLSMGQVLCRLMIAAGAGLAVVARRRPPGR